MNENELKNEIKELRNLLELANDAIDELCNQNEFGNELDKFEKEFDIYEQKVSKKDCFKNSSSFSVLKVIPFKISSSSLASCVIACGEVIIRCKLFRSSSNGRIFLSMPAKIDKNGKYWDCCTINNRDTFNEIERIAIEIYNSKIKDSEK